MIYILKAIHHDCDYSWEQIILASENKELIDWCKNLLEEPYLKARQTYEQIYNYWLDMNFEDDYSLELFNLTETLEEYKDFQRFEIEEIELNKFLG